ncbi:hypothetical protein [Flammeovirga aprica]|uniref:Uncharacterized protein n=1 Tax=Flammeovirga aprica JL-4 TaxID=694437 RepID=A0A7X9RWJ4_9BACT|nr:hypothetical protein [Flammeovirga aprica]NME70026.1 hypothetical protein [Flammeovirga aprica JL-4]
MKYLFLLPLLFVYAVSFAQAPYYSFEELTFKHEEEKTGFELYLKDSTQSLSLLQKRLRAL